VEGAGAQDGRSEQGVQPLRPLIEVLILRDPRESPRKCSLTPLRGAPGLTFASFHPERRLAAGRRILLHPGGELLSAADRGAPLLLVDCAWRRVPQLLASVDGELLARRLPPLSSAYPRASKLFADPEQGLASVEALYAALRILGEPRPELLSGYRWAREFLERNPELAAASDGSSP
jgi:pre-rRNA-processing protein TSR3